MIAQRQDYLDSRILIIDDQQQTVMLLRSILHEEGFRHLTCLTDPVQAVELFCQTPFDLVMLDLDMPVMNGFEVMERLRRAKPPDSYLPVLVVTGQIDRDSRLRALAAGAKDFVTKPFDFLEIINRIRNMLEVRLLHNALRDNSRRLEEAVLERTWELRETQQEIVRRLCRAAEYRDSETGQHILRMSSYAQIIARTLGWSMDQADLILAASPMHDIGKIGVSDSILLKPGKLTADEMDQMKAHTTIGASILDGHTSELLATARDVALTHHERWDGLGYPHGRKSCEIPISGRICALADVFDAQTSLRPYKREWPVDASLADIQGNSGIKFDPEIVEAFVACLPELLAVREIYSSDAAREAACAPAAGPPGDQPELGSEPLRIADFRRHG
jgi:putative two-component system response regulator